MDSRHLFRTLVAEGETCYRRRDYKRAGESFTKALKYRPSDRTVLLARSKCAVALGYCNQAVADAERSIAGDKTFYKGLYQKAEALFASGNFEYGLIFYHRAHRLRPDIFDYRLGIQKAEQAILGAIAQQGPFDRARIRDHMVNPSKLHQSTANKQRKVKEDDSVDPLSENPWEILEEEFGGLPDDVVKEDLPGMAQNTLIPLKKKAAPSKTLLGDLFEDRKFLEKLRNDGAIGEKRHETKSGRNAVSEFVDVGLSYIDARSRNKPNTRTEFWRQQKPTSNKTTKLGPTRTKRRSIAQPLGAVPLKGLGPPNTLQSSSNLKSSRVKSGPSKSKIAAVPSLDLKRATGKTLDHRVIQSARRPQSKKPSTAPGGSRTVRAVATPRVASATIRGDQNLENEKKKFAAQTRYVAKALENIQEAIEHGATDLALQFCKALQARLTSLEMPDKPKLLADLNSAMGSIYFEMGKLTLSLVHHRRDLDISVKYSLDGSCIRALRNLGRTYQRMRDYKAAATMFSKIYQLDCGDAIKGDATLQIGRCFFDTEDWEQSIAYGKKSLSLLQSLRKKKHSDGVEVEAAPSFGLLKDPTNSELELDALCLIGRSLCMLGKTTEAKQTLQECLDLSREWEDKTAEAAALTNLSIIALQAGTVREGMELQRQAIEATEAINK